MSAMPDVDVREGLDAIADALAAVHRSGGPYELWNSDEDDADYPERTPRAVMISPARYAELLEGHP